MTIWVGIGAAVGCGLGAVLRYLLGRIPHPWDFPWPTILANVLGSALLGAVLRTVDGGAAGAVWIALLGAGVAGGLTTFSSLAVDALVQWKDGARAAAGIYLATTFVAGLGAVAAGWALAGAWV